MTKKTQAKTVNANANQATTAKRVHQVKPRKGKTKAEIVELTPAIKATTKSEKTKTRQTKFQTSQAKLKNYNDKQQALRDNSETIEENILANIKTGLSYWKELGEGAIEYRKNWVANGGDIKARGEESFLTYRTSFQDAYGRMDKNKFNEIIMIAQNWDTVLKMDTTDELEKMGFSKCVKAIRETKKTKAKQGPAISATSKKSKVQMTATQLIKATLKTAEQNNIPLADVLIELKKQLTATIKK